MIAGFEGFLVLSVTRAGYTDEKVLSLEGSAYLICLFRLVVSRLHTMQCFLFSTSVTYSPPTGPPSTATFL